MINLIKTENEEIIKSVLLDPAVFKSSGGRQEELKDFKIPVGYTYVIAYLDDKIVGMYHYRYISKITIESHLSILPEYQGTQESIDAGKAFLEYCKYVLKIHKIVGMVWSSNEKCIKHVMKQGFTVFAVLRNAVIHNDKYNNLVYLEYIIKA